MTSNYLTFNHFSKTLLEPIFEVFEVLDNSKHPENKNLLIDLNSIDKIDLNNFVKGNDIDFLIRKSKNIDIERRAYYFIYQITKDIFRIRIDKLTESTERPCPYNFFNLHDLIIDKNKLALIKQFNIDKLGFEKNKLVYTLCPTLEQSNSSYWIFKTILRLAKINKINFKIRLDPFIEIPQEQYRLHSYKSLDYGKEQLDWQRILNLRNDDFGRWFNEKEYNRIGFTEYVWSPKKKLIHFTCEELPKNSFQGIKISRYFHSIFKKDTGGIIHCDGAIRIYSDCEFESRIKFHVKDPEFRKAGKRVKIFQYESVENKGTEIDKEIFYQLLTSFFVWNNDIQNYFNK